MTAPFDWDAVDAELSDAEPVPERTNLGMYNGKPIPDNALFNEDGTPQLTPTGRIKRKRGANGPRATNTRAPNNAELARNLCDPLAKAAMALSFAMPTASAVLLERGERTADALVAIAAGHPRMLAALQKASKVGPAAELLETGLMIAIAVSLDTGNLAPEHPLAALTGVGNLYRAVHPDMPGDGHSGPAMADPPPFMSKVPSGDITDPDHPRYSFQAGNVFPNREGSPLVS